ncbi:MAG: undecaprenyl-diphosphate phosphatase [Actinomycetes bacterium]
MSILHAIVLGIVQGLTEFLPISSSGHLVLVPDLLGWNDFGGNDALNKAFDVALHLGTLVGAVWYFRRDLAGYLVAAGRSVTRRSVADPQARIAWLLLLSAVPAAVVGAALSSTIDEHLGRPVLVGVMLILGGLLLWWADHLGGTRSIEDYAPRDATVMGIAQAIALQPGVSRSGVTITAGLWLGLDRIAATRLSFLMSLPIIAGAGIFSAVRVAADGGLPPGSGPAFLAGFVAAGIAGWIAIAGLLSYLRTRTFMPFVWYRLVVGSAVIVIFATGLR